MKEIFLKEEKRIMRSVAVLAMFTFMITSAAAVANTRKAELAAVEVPEHAIAGIASVMTGVETEALYTAVSVNESGVETVAAQLTENAVLDIDEETVEDFSKEAAAAEVEAVEAEASDSEWENVLMTSADDYMNVRTEASVDSALAGKLRKGDVAEITEIEDGWYEITSGNLTGYVSADYVVTGDAAKEYAEEICVTYVESTTGGLRVRSEASEEGDVITALGEGEKLEFDAEAEEIDGWTAVSYGGDTGYVKSEYAEVYLATGTGITAEEERQALEKAEAAKKAAEAPVQQASNTVATVQNEAVPASYDDVTLLAALIQCEAGYEIYEGQVAVGAVVINRLHSGYGGSIYDVIYARGQFGPAGSGKVAAAAAAGPRASCIQAAQEALAGIDNTGGARNFRNVSSGHAGVVIGNHVFW